MLKKISFFAVIALSAGGYIPILIGGFIQPSEVNLATYELWTIIVLLMLYSSIQQKQEWILPFAWAIGNISTIVILFAFPRKWMFNLGDAESVALYGIVIVVGTWATVGGITKHWNPRILFLGSVAVDVASFYPVIKQYLLPHALPTEFLLLGWTMFILGAFINLVFVDEFIGKVIRKEENLWSLVEKSALSLENIFFLSLTTLLMMR